MTEAPNRQNKEENDTAQPERNDQSIENDNDDLLDGEGDPSQDEAEPRPLTAEEILAREILIENRARQNNIFSALETSISEKRSIPTPPHKGFLSCAYLFVMDRQRLNEYREEKRAYREAQKELYDLERDKRSWLRLESELYDDGLKLEPEVGGIAGKIKDGTASKAEVKKFQKEISKISGRREAIDGAFARAVAVKIAVTPTEIKRPAFGSLERSSDPGLSPREREQAKKDEQEAEQKIVSRVVQGLLDEKKEERTLKDEIGEAGHWFTDDIESGYRAIFGKGNQRFAELTEKSKKIFLEQESTGSIAEVARAMVRIELIEEKIQGLNGAAISENPILVNQLVVALRVARLEQKNAEAKMTLAIEAASKQSLFEEVKQRTLAGVKQTVGRTVFATDESFIIDAETKMSEVILSGQNQLSETIVASWKAWNFAKRAGVGLAAGTVSLRKSFNEKFAQIIPESVRASEKVTEMTVVLTDLESKGLDAAEATKTINEVRRQAKENREKRLLEEVSEREKKNIVERKKVVDGMVAGMVGMLEISNKDKAKLSELYDKEGLSDEFLDKLVEKYQKTKLSIERKTIKAREDLRELQERREWLISLLDGAGAAAGETSAEEIEKELEGIDEDLERKFAEVYGAIGAITNEVRASVKNLEGDIERSLYSRILNSIAH